MRELALKHSKHILTGFIVCVNANVCHSAGLRGKSIILLIRFGIAGPWRCEYYSCGKSTSHGCLELIEHSAIQKIQLTKAPIAIKYLFSKLWVLRTALYSCLTIPQNLPQKKKVMFYFGACYEFGCR